MGGGQVGGMRSASIEDIGIGYERYCGEGVRPGR
jgi:hypothetical protein